MICHVITVFLTFVKSMVSTTSFVNIYTIDGLKLVLSPGAPSPIFHEKVTPFVYLLLTNGTSFTYPVSNFASLLTAVNAPSIK